MEGMEAHMTSMHEMLEKLMAAKTPEKRYALIPQHLKTMQDGMAMMEMMMDRVPPAPSR